MIDDYLLDNKNYPRNICSNEKNGPIYLPIALIIIKQTSGIAKTCDFTGKKM